MGKELLFKVLRHEEAERVPWVPFAGVHAGKLKGYTAREILEDAAAADPEEDVNVVDLD